MQFSFILLLYIERCHIRVKNYYEENKKGKMEKIEKTIEKRKRKEIQEKRQEILRGGPVKGKCLLCSARN
jgi:hypothetical protein